MMKRIYIILLLLACVLNAYAIKVVFRLDDPTVRYDSVHSRLIQLFIDNDVPLSIGVIPCDSSEMAYEPNDTGYLELLQSPLIEVCLHGLTHQKIEDKGEFGALDGAESKRRIAKGKAILSQRIGKDIVTFIPPWNVINDSIPYILAEEGFKVISGELFVESLERMPKGVDIMYIPETLGHLMAHHGVLKAARETIFRHSSDDAVCVIMIHAYDFPDENAWTELNDMLEDCKADSEVELYTFSSLYESEEKMDRALYKANLLPADYLKSFYKKELCIEHGYAMLYKY